MSEAQIVVVVGRQRSGTTAFSETLAAGAPLRSFGEVFHHTTGDAQKANDLRLQPEANFFLFKSELLKREPSLSCPSTDNQSRILDLFLSHLGALTDQKWLLLDIKYNSWHHFEHIYSVPGQAPFLFHLLKKRNAAFAHIKRRGLLERYCSEQLALQSGLWHAERGTLPGSDKFQLIVDPVAALRDMIEGRRQIEMFERFLIPIARRIELTYEEIFNEDHLSKTAEMRVGRLLDSNWEQKKTVPLQKVTPPLRDVIRNIDEVRAFFQSTTFAADVERALA